MRHTTMTAILALITLSACDDGYDGGQSGSAEYGCLPTSTADLALDETSALGFAPQALLELAEGTSTGTFSFEAGGSSNVSITFTGSGEARFEQRDWQDDGSGVAPALGCSDVVLVSGTLAVVTADGSVDETVEVELEASTPELAGWFAELSSLGGSYQFDESPYDEVRYFLTGSFEAGGSTGELSAQGVNEDSEVATATNLTIGSWGN